MHKAIAKICIFFLLLICSAKNSFAQNYPIQTNLSLTPPYTLSLPSYATETERFSVQLINKDFATPIVDLYLQLKIEGPGVTIETKPSYRPSSAITTTAGVPLLLSGVDLSELFDPSNLNFSGLNLSEFISGGSYLPEGFYRFSVRALDYHQNIQISNWSIASTAIFKHLPPIINLPQDKSYVGLQTPQYLQIQFTPRHTISPSLIGKIRYKIRLVEVLPNTRNPNEAMQSSSIPFFETLTDQTNFIYGPGEPAMVDGRTYALQVQAVDGDGKDLFENKGYSQVVSFVYGSPCPIPLNVKANPGDGTGINITWDPNDKYRSFMVYYRVKGQENYKTEISFSNGININQLQPNTLYEIKVTGVCAENESDRSPAALVKTAALPTEYHNWSKNCGKPLPSIDLSNKSPLPMLQAGDIIFAGDFEVKISASQGGNGIFSGSGFVTLPFTGKVPLPCSFENITLNTDKRMVFGKISLLQQPLELSNRTVQNLAKNWRSLFGSNWNRVGNYKYPGKIDKIYLDESSNEIKIEGSSGTKKIAKGKNIEIEDENHKFWYISEGGKSSPAEGPKTKPIVKDIETGDGIPSELPPGMAKLFFSADTKNGYDALEVSTLTAGKTYDRMESADTTYSPGWQLAKAGEKVKVNAIFVQGKKFPCPIDSIKFARSDGTLLPFTRNGTEFTILATGRMNLYSDAIWAFATYSINPKYSAERWILGKLNLVNVDVKIKNVVLIPVNGIGETTDAKSLQQNVNNFLNSFGVIANIKVDKTYTQNDYNAATEKLSVSKTVMNIGYKYQLGRFIEGYKTGHPQTNNNPSNDTSYLFLVNQSTDNTLGYMGLNEQFGFVFLNGHPIANPLTLAHELGHGALNLEHPFGGDLSKAAQSQNLMDYAPPFSLSNYRQWMAVHDAAILEKLFTINQNVKFGKMLNWRKYTLEELGITAKNEYLNFVAPNGKIITLHSDSIEGLSFSGTSIMIGTHQLSNRARKAFGVLGAFIYQGKNCGLYTQGNKFRGYYQNRDYTSSRFDINYFYRNTKTPDLKIIAGIETKDCELQIQSGQFTNQNNTDTLIKSVFLKNENLLKKIILTDDCLEYFNADSLTISAKKWWEAAQTNAQYKYNTSSVKRIVRLINDLGDDYRYYNYESYKNFIAKYKPKYLIKNVDHSKPFDSVGLRLFENYLRAAIFTLADHNKFYASITNPEELFQFLLTLPKGQYSGLTLKNRVRCLRVLSTEWLTSISWEGWLRDGGTERIVTRLITTTPDKDVSAMLDSLNAKVPTRNNATLLASLCRDASGLDGDNYTVFVMTITRWILKNWPIDEQFTLNKAVEDGKYINFTPGFIGSSVGEWFDKDGNIILAFGPKFSNYSLALRAHPYEYIKFNFTEDYDLGSLKFKKNVPVKLPAVLIFAIFTTENGKKLLAGSKLAFDLGLFALGIGEVRMAFQATNTLKKVFYVTKSIIDLGLSAGDIVINDILINKLAKTEAGKQFLDKWNTYSLYIGLGSMTLSGMDVLLKKASENLDDIKKLKVLNLADEQKLDDVVSNMYKTVTKGRKLAAYAGKIEKGKNLMQLENPTSLFRQLKNNTNTYKAATFWADESADMVHYVSKDANYYIKHDPTTGRALFLDAENEKFMGFMLDQDDLIKGNYENLMENLKMIHGVPGSKRHIVVNGYTIEFSEGKATIVLGKYDPNSIPGISGEIGTDDIMKNMQMMKNYSFADKSFELRKGSIHLLNIPDGMYDAKTFFEKFNKEILDLAINNPDLVKVVLVSDPRKGNLLTKFIGENQTDLPSFFAMEIKYLKENGITKVFLKDGSLLDLNSINLNNLDWSEWK